MKKFTEDITATFKKVNEALLKATQKMREQNDAENFDIPVG